VPKDRADKDAPPAKDNPDSTATDMRGSTRQHQPPGKLSPRAAAEQAVVNQKKALESGEESPS